MAKEAVQIIYFCLIKSEFKSKVFFSCIFFTRARDRKLDISTEWPKPCVSICSVSHRERPSPPPPNMAVSTYACDMYKSHSSALPKQHSLLVTTLFIWIWGFSRPRKKIEKSYNNFGSGGFKHVPVVERTYPPACPCCQQNTLKCPLWWPNVPQGDVIKCPVSGGTVMQCVQLVLFWIFWGSALQTAWVRLCFFNPNSPFVLPLTDSWAETLEDSLSICFITHISFI